MHTLQTGSFGSIRHSWSLVPQRLLRALLLVSLSLSVLGAWGCSGGSAEPSAVAGTSRQALDETRALSGTVFGGGVPLAAAVVEALENGTTTAVGSSTSDASGRYALNLAPGTYDLRVTPPTGSGFSVYVQQDVVVSDDALLDVVLIAEGGAVSGTVRGYGGVGVKNLLVYAYTGGVQVASTTTDSTGAYALNLGAGSYQFVVNSNYPYGEAGVPSNYFYLYTPTMAITGATALDISLPVAKVSGVVTDPNGAAVAGVGLSSSGSTSTAGGGYGYFGNSTATTAADGSYELLVFTGGQTMTVSPGVPFGTIVDSSVSVSGDTTRDFQLSAATLVSGTVRGYGGVGVKNLLVYAYAGGVQVASTTTDSTGAYALNLGAGSYQFVVNSNYPYGEAGVPSNYFYLYTPTMAITGATALDISLPVAKVSGVVTDPNGAAVAGVVLSSSGSTSTAEGGYGYFGNSTTTTAADGSYELLVFTGGQTMTVSPGVPFGTIVDSSVSVSGDTTRDFQLSAATLVSGTVRGYGGVGVKNLLVYAYAGGVQVASTTTDSTGAYALNLGAGSYQLVVNSNYPYGEAGVPSNYFYLYTPTMAITGATALDISLPVAKVSGVVTDSNGAPVPGVVLSSSGSTSTAEGGYGYFGNSTATSAADGSYQVLVFTGTPVMTIVPVAVSGFSTTVLSNLSVSGDFSQVVVLQRPDLSPPVIVSGPLVVHLSDTAVSVSWVTNEPSSSLVEYGPGSLSQTVSQSEMVTAHAVTLLNLSPSTDYVFRVSSTDAAGNGPTRSATLTFRTQDPPGDITAPVITAGPSVTSLGLDSAVIAWDTDEPASSVVRYGLAAAALDTTVSVVDRFTLNHVTSLSGLSPATQYFYRVESTDPDGNGPTPSAVASFVTAALPDTTAPLIISGPTISASTSTTLTVSWITNEAATSGVSYNDGAVFNVVTGDDLVTSHSVVLAGLNPDTSYQITVSSVDFNSNGPTLGGPISGRTLAAADTLAPVISQLTVSNIGETSATISWTTDEPSTSQVSFGTTSGAPTGLQGDSALVTAHSIVVAGLVPGSTYYFSVTSQDGSANSAQSDEEAFVTASSDADGDGLNDAADACLGTAPGDVVDDNGCSVAQLCPCEGPRGGTTPWPRQASYVACVGQAAESFWRAGRMSLSAARALYSAANHANCGRH